MLGLFRDHAVGNTRMDGVNAQRVLYQESQMSWIDLDAINTENSRNFVHDRSPVYDTLVEFVHSCTRTILLTFFVSLPGSFNTVSIQKGANVVCATKTYGSGG